MSVDKESGDVRMISEDFAGMMSNKDSLTLLEDQQNHSMMK